MDYFKRSKFDKLIEKATSEMLIESDIESTIAICDIVRSQEISPKYAVQCLKKRLQCDNPNVVLHSLDVLESLMKNCGALVHEEVCSTEFMQELVGMIDISPDVRAKLLECLQNWAYVFRDKPGYAAVTAAYENLKNAGYVFPEFSESAAMFSVVCAPSWKEGNACHRCKSVFTTFRRKHHCRKCGQVFCGECTSSRTVLPEFGIEKEVRVCDLCFETINRPSSVSENTEDRKSIEKENQLRREKERQLEQQENEDLELALALSASEAESNQRNNQIKSSVNVDKLSSSSTSGVVHLLPVLDTSEMDPELAQYLSKHYQRAHGPTQDSTLQENSQEHLILQQFTTQPSAPIYASSTPSDHSMISMSSLKSGVNSSFNVTGNQPNTLVSASVKNKTDHNMTELTNPKQEEFLDALRGSIEFFVNRLQSNSQRGRNISSDTAVQALFTTLNEMHPQLMNYKHYMEERRSYFEKLQDKLNQIREAREALDALRHDHAVRKQMEEQEAARIRQLQIMQKLEAMRQQKRDTLEYKLRMTLKQNMQYQQEYGMPQQPLTYNVESFSSISTGAPADGYPPNYALPYVSGPNYISFPSVQNGYLPRDNKVYTTQFPDPNSLTSNHSGTGGPSTNMVYTPQVQPPYISTPVGHDIQRNRPFPQGIQNPTPPGTFSMQSIQAALPSYAGQDDSKDYPLNQTYPTGKFVTDTKNAPNYTQTVARLNDAPNNYIEPTTTEAQLISFD
ncbi:Hepatocyte growth factor-regulated tyrosine kinase substrate [Schistosoma japonicum]|nr:Hepatocyte growth factor-regulated tyrosine kinase substrate [Schistosoma japonicum]